MELTLPRISDRRADDPSARRLDLRHACRYPRLAAHFENRRSTDSSFFSVSRVTCFSRVAMKLSTPTVFSRSMVSKNGANRLPMYTSRYSLNVRGSIVASMSASQIAATSMNGVPFRAGAAFIPTAQRPETTLA